MGRKRAISDASRIGVDTPEKRKRLESLIAEAFRHRRRLGLVPFNGRWLAPEQAQECARRSVRHHIELYAELALLLLSVIFSGLALILILSSITY